MNQGATHYEGKNNKLATAAIAWPALIGLGIWILFPDLARAVRFIGARGFREHMNRDDDGAKTQDAQKYQ